MFTGITFLIIVSVLLSITGGTAVAYGAPVLHDEHLVLEVFTSEFGWGYTAMAFVGDDILLLEKGGTVRLVDDGKLSPFPVYTVMVDSVRESGLLGITTVEGVVDTTTEVSSATGNADTISVYLYFTESDESGKALGNRIYKYDWNGSTLVNPVLIKELPSNSYHNSGAMVTGLDGQVYAVIGDTGKYGPLQNKNPGDIYPPGTLDYLDTSVILRVDPSGPYKAIGIRNSFGLAVDPVTGNLWATENGDDDFDEINLIPEKFNSGWRKIMGPATESEVSSLPGYEDYVYKDPLFSWERTVAPTGISFAKFEQTDLYDNSFFVGDCNNGNLYKFEVNSDRDSLVFETAALGDGVADIGDSLDEIIIGSGFRCITDIERGPDGFLYLISHGENTIYRIIPAAAAASENSGSDDGNVAVSGGENNKGGGCLIATAAYGTEMAPQVQQLREIRDDKLMGTGIGSGFMVSFNSIYYSFSPAIADYQRENPLFKEAVKIVISPMLSTLFVMDAASTDSDAEIFGYGILVILLNAVMYVVAPVIAFMGIKKYVYKRSGSKPQNDQCTQVS